MPGLSFAVGICLLKWTDAEIIFFPISHAVSFWLPVMTIKVINNKSLTAKSNIFSWCPQQFAWKTICNYRKVQLSNWIIARAESVFEPRALEQVWCKCHCRVEYQFGGSRSFEKDRSCQYCPTFGLHNVHLGDCSWNSTWILEHICYYWFLKVLHRKNNPFTLPHYLRKNYV